MNKKKTGLVAIILFLFVGLTSFVFANADKEELATEVPERKEGVSSEETTEVTKNGSVSSENTLSTDDNQSDGQVNTQGATDGNQLDSQVNTQSTTVESAPVVQSLGITNIDDYKDETGKLYVKKGGKVRVLVYFDEKLGTEPTIKLGGKEFTATYREASSKPENNSYAYYADIKITDELVLNEGVIPFEVYGYKDNAGNEGVLLTQDNVNMSSYPSVTLDNTNPVFTGLSNGKYYQDDITVNVDDKNLDKITAKVYADNYKVIEIENGSKLTKESIYLLTAIDKAGNKTSIYVAVDKTAPVFTTVKNGHQYNKDVEIKVEDLKVKTIELYSYNDKTTKTIENGYVLKEEGTYAITATDYAGRSTKVYVTIDKTKPSITGFEDGSYNNKNEIVYVKDDNLATVTINGVEYEHDGKYFEKKLTHEGTYTVVATDRAGNTVTKTVTIDRTNPVFTGLSNGKYYQDDITVNVDDKNLDKITAKVYADNYKVIEIENGSKLTKESIYLLTAIDKAGNKTSIYVAVDKTNPVFTTVKNGHQYNKDVEIKVEDLKVKTIELYSYNDKTTKTIENGYVLKEEGTYAITATDYAGRSTKVYITIDKTKPVLKAANILVDGDKNEQKYFYAKIGDTIYSYVRFNEELKENPTFTLVNNGKKYEVKDVTKRAYDNGEYGYSIKYTIDENTEMTDGEIEMLVTNIKDRAGNEYGDITKPTNGHVVYLDTKAPERVYSTLDFDKSGKEYYENENKQKEFYVTNNDSFVFRMQFTEKLQGEPILHVGKLEIPLVLNQKHLTNEGKYIYEGTVNISEAAGLSEGKIEFTLSNVVDEAGNVTTDKVVLNQTPTSNARIAIYDVTAPKKVALKLIHQMKIKNMVK